MPDYSKGKIYKLHILGNEELIYYGSTIQTLSLRISGHRREYRRWETLKNRYYTSFKLFDTDFKNVVITLIEKFPCNCKNELEAKERFYIQNNICVNKNIPTRTKKEWEQENKEKIAKQKKEYNKTEKIKEYFKKYNIINKEKIKEYNKKRRQTEKYKQNRKEYDKNYNRTDKRKEYMKEYMKEWREDNKEKQSEKIECQYCKSIIRKFGLKRHQKTEKCKAFQNEI